MAKETLLSVKRKLKSSRDQLKLLKRITATISYELDINDVMQHVVEVVAETMKADSCLIYLVQKDQLILKASKIPRPRVLNTVVMNKGEGITGWAAQHHEMVVIDKNAIEDKRFKKVSQLNEDEWESFVSVPIEFKNKLIGVINVQNKKARKYSKEQIDLLGTIASQVGGAIYNARLISETQLLKEALTTRKIIEQAKGLLMEHNALTEEKAYQLIRKKAMNSKQNMRVVAEAIILTLG